MSVCNFTLPALPSISLDLSLPALPDLPKLPACPFD